MLDSVLKRIKEIVHCSIQLTGLLPVNKQWVQPGDYFIIVHGISVRKIVRKHGGSKAVRAKSKFSRKVSFRGNSFSPEKLEDIF